VGLRQTIEIGVKEPWNMASFNRVILVGNVTRDPELRYVPSGMAVTDIGLAVNDRRKNATTGEWIEETTFVDVTLWGRTAEVAGEYLSKGAPVLIEGRLKLDSWEGTDGQKRSKLKVVGEKMQLLGAKGGGDGSGGRAAAPRGRAASNQADAAPPDEFDAPPPSGGDDIPF
jgi:single-strand DNA-binding protein